MRVVMTVCLLVVLAANQGVPAGQVSSGAVVPAKSPNDLLIPAGTKVPLSLKHAISTKASREGDAVYAETTFPVVGSYRVLIPAGTYVQGRISQIERAGRIKGRAEVLIHFTTLIYPSGYTVMLPGSLENAPGLDKSKVKDSEGSIQADGQKAQTVGRVAGTGATGAVIGGATEGGKGALIGAGVGGAVGTAIALLSRGNDVKLDAGTTLEMVIQREVTLDASRVPNVTRTASSSQ